MSTSKNEKVIIMASLTGHRGFPELVQYIPTTPEQIAEEAYKCYQAGAAFVHVHAVDEKTKISISDIRVFGNTLKKIRGKCPILIEITGAVGSVRDPVTNKRIWASDAERLNLLNMEPLPDLVPTPVGTVDYMYPDGYATFFNTPDFLKKMIPAIIKKKIGWEAEIFEVGWLYRLLNLAEEGIFDRNTPVLLNLAMMTGVGIGGLQPATPRHVVYLSDEAKRLFPQATWTVLTRGDNYYQIITLGMSLGCHLVRTGFEDHFRLPSGEVAKNSYQLVESAVKIARDLGRDIATVEEAREILSLPK